MTDGMTPVDLAADRVPWRVTVTLEAVLYLALGVLALLLRVAELDSVALGNAEAREALAAWHFVMPGAPGTAPLASSPLLFLLNSGALALMGGSDLAARLATALGGVALVLLPLLWRRELGRVAALLTSCLLALSAVGLVASRTMSPALWATILAVIGLKLLVRFVQERRVADAVAATTLLAATALLADPAGFALLIALLIGWGIANRLSRDVAPADQPGPRLHEALQVWPWRAAALTSVATIGLVATVVFLVPAGLSQVGELLERGLAELTGRLAGNPFAFPLLAALLYEPALWLLGAIGALHTLRVTPSEQGGSLVDRCLLGWIAGGIVMAVVYAGAGPDHALWLVVPLAALGGRTLARIIAPVLDPLWRVPGWAVPVLAAGYLALLFISAANFVWVARALQGMTADFAPAIQPLRVVLAGMSLLLVVILFFLGASLWGTRAASRSLTLAFVAFFMVYGLSSGWRIAVTHVDDPRELWHVAPVDRDLGLLRETLVEASLRQTGGPSDLAFVAGVPDDGAVAWQMRDYPNLRYVAAIEAQAAGEVLVAPGSFMPETLGARYVGQDFIVQRAWEMTSLRWADVPVWLMYGEALVPAQASERVVVWARDDVYGLPPETASEESAP